MKQFLKQAIKYLFLILAVAVLGCDDDDETNFPQVEAGFTYTLNENSGTVTFINISSEARTYLWTFGDGGTSTEINPIKTFANGTYKVNLKATSVSGASATFEDTIIISIPNPITLPVTFDEPNVNYSVASFNGASFDIVDNPDVSGSNDKASKVGAITNSGAAFEGINFDLGTQLDLTTDKTIQMNFWSDSPVDVLLKLEQGTGPDIEVTTGHGGTGWELISFDFNSSNKYVRMTIFVDGPGTKAGTFYIDDIAQIETPPKPCEEETTQSFDAADFNLTFQTDPGDKISSFDAALTTVQNPDTDNLVNNSCQVGQIDRNGGALFANNQIDFNEKFDFNNNSGFKMKVWSPVAGTNVLVKLEDKTNSNINTEIGAKTTTANAWEELTFDFSSEQSGKYDKIIFFFELNTNTTQTYFIDDFKLYKSDDGGGADCTAETVESISAADLNMTFLTDQTPNFIEDGADFEWIDNPDVANSVNSSCKVGQITKLGNNPWDNNQFDLDGKLDFNANDGLKIKVWSARANTEVRIKLEEIGNPGNNTEQFLITSVTSGWEELTFPFAAENSNKFNKIVIFFDLNANNTDTYYFDDLKLYSDGGGGPVCTAETVESISAADLNMTFLTDQTPNFIEDGADFEWIDNPDVANSVNSSCKVGQITKLGNNPWDNNQFDLDGKLDFNANDGLKIKVWSARANTEVRIKLEEIGNPGNNTEQFLITSVTSGWEELTFPFAAENSNKFNKIVIFFDLNANNTDTYYFDDLKLYSDGGGSPVCTAETVESISAADLNMTFLTDQTPNFIEDGADFEWIDNPDVANSVNSSCKVGQITKLGNNPWDNNQFDLDGKLDFNANDGLKIKVWSARANTEVRIKLEEIGNPGNNTEQFLITSVTSGWEELTFPFAAENSNKFNKIVIFFDLNANNTDTYYFDDLKLYSDGGGSPDCTPPVGDLVADGGFESGADTCWSLFQNGGTAALDNTTNNGGSWSGKLATNGPSNPAFKQERIGVGTVSAGDVVQIKFDHLGSVVQPGAVFNVLLFGEGSNGASFTHVFNPAPALSDSWTTFTGTFTIPAGTDVSSGISFLIEAVCGGDAGCSVSANIDNVSVILNP